MKPQCPFSPSFRHGEGNGHTAWTHKLDFRTPLIPRRPLAAKSRKARLHSVRFCCGFPEACHTVPSQGICRLRQYGLRGHLRDPLYPGWWGPRVRRARSTEAHHDCVSRLPVQTEPVLSLPDRSMNATETEPEEQNKRIPTTVYAQPHSPK